MKTWFQQLKVVKSFDSIARYSFIRMSQKNLGLFNNKKCVAKIVTDIIDG